jgi:integrase
MTTNNLADLVDDKPTRDHVNWKITTEELIELRQNGKSNAEISRITGMPYNTVASRFWQYKKAHGSIPKAPRSVPNKQEVESSKEPEEPKEQPKLTLAQRIKVLFTGKVD